MAHNFGIPEKTSILNGYEGKPVCVHFNDNQSVYGVFIKINNNASPSYAEFQPSLVANPDASEISLVTDVPTRILLPAYSVRPLPQGMLERFVEQKKIAKNKATKK